MVECRHPSTAQNQPGEGGHVAEPTQSTRLANLSLVGLSDGAQAAREPIVDIDQILPLGTSSVTRSVLPLGFTDCMRPRIRKWKYCSSSASWAVWPGLSAAGRSGGLRVCRRPRASGPLSKISSKSNETEPGSTSIWSESMATPCERSALRELGQAQGNILARAEDEDRAAQADHVPRLEHPHGALSPLIFVPLVLCRSVRTTWS